MRAVLISLLALCLAWPVAAESLTGCRGLADAERLACYDRTAGDDRALLTGLLGDPGAVGQDYSYLANSETVRAQLPGRWLIARWEVMAGLLGSDSLGRACERQGVEIAPDPEDSFAMTLSRADMKGEVAVRERLLWTGGNSFALLRNLDRSLAYLGLDPERMGYAATMNVIRYGAQPLSLLPLSPDLVLGLEGQGFSALVLARCP